MSTKRYRTQARDTTIEVERVLIERYRGMSPAGKLAIVRGLGELAEELAIAGSVAGTLTPRLAS